jgi:hypothetical protein
MSWPPWKHDEKPVTRSDPPSLFPPYPLSAPPQPALTPPDKKRQEPSMTDVPLIPPLPSSSPPPVTHLVPPVDLPIDLQPYRTMAYRPSIMSPATIDPALRQALLGLGVQFGALMMRAGTTPEDVAQQTGLNPEMIYQIMTGREANVGVGDLATIAKHLGSSLVIQLSGPSSPPATSSAAQGSAPSA